MELLEAILQRRTKRKFTDKKVPHEFLEKLVDCARYAPAGANRQPLKYIFLEEESLVKKIFPYTKWSGYHPEDAPNENEQPTAYIAILGDKNIKPNENFEIDAGAAGTIISLVAEDLGLSSCWLGSIDKKELAKMFNLDDNLVLLYLIALGYSDQKARAHDAKGDIKYYTDAEGVLNVPKRPMDEILIKL
ncbi:MAG: nitroreductase [Ruminococcaceae bacterium]|nr:nitroreductase [Oscillospiraceae bacterium]